MEENEAAAARCYRLHRLSGYITILLLSLFTATMNLFFSFWVDGDADVSLSLLTVFVRLVLSAALSFQLAASGSNHESFTAEHLRFTSQL